MKTINNRPDNRLWSWVGLLAAIGSTLLGVTTCIAQTAPNQMINAGPKKQLIEFGWYSPYLNQYANDPAKYDIDPLDGTTLKITEAAVNGFVFRVDDWQAVDPAEKQRNLDWAKAIATPYPAGEWTELNFPKRLSGQGKMLTTEEKSRWLEHNTYHALRTADQYAWLYTERQNWFTGELVPEGFVDAVGRGKQKAIQLQPLGFSIEAMMETARDKAEAFYAKPGAPQ